MLLARMNFFSDELEIKQLGAKQDIDEVFELQKNHTSYHQQFKPGLLEKKQIKAEMIQIPKGKSLDSKFYLGFYQAGRLVAVLDLVMDYPKANCAWVGLLIVDINKLRTGIGTNAWEIAKQALKREGYAEVLLAIPAGDTRAQRFWQKQNFRVQQSFQMKIKDGMDIPLKLMQSGL